MISSIRGGRLRWDDVDDGSPRPSAPDMKNESTGCFIPDIPGTTVSIFHGAFTANAIGFIIRWRGPLPSFDA